MNHFSHVDKKGKAQMVDIGGKIDQRRTAKAQGKIELSPETIKLIRENQIQKGDVLTVAKIAAINAAKQTAYLIPLCHPLMIDVIDVECTIENNCVHVKCLVKCTGKTGVEMEALMAVNIALLTIYDMCKAVDKNMQIGEIQLIEKNKTSVGK